MTLDPDPAASGPAAPPPDPALPDVPAQRAPADQHVPPAPGGDARAGDSRFVGAGLGFPLRTTATGAIALVRGHAELEESMRLILGTAPGERPRRPEFGCGVHDLVFDAVDAELASRVAAEVRAALLRWEPRIDVLAVHVAPDPDRPVVLLIDVQYAVRDTNDARNLVVPFYALPGEDA